MNKKKMIKLYFKNGVVLPRLNAYEALEKLVERDTPKKIEYENNGIPYCAVCERSYLRDVRGNQNRFCGYCGQRLDWEE